MPFDAKVVSLGVSLGLAEVWDGFLTVENKPGRLEKISQLLQDLASGRSVINFAGGLIMGFELKPTSRMLSKALSGPYLGSTPELKQASKRCPATVLPPIVLYTDGAFEKSVGIWGPSWWMATQVLDGPPGEKGTDSSQDIGRRRQASSFRHKRVSEGPLCAGFH